MNERDEGYIQGLSDLIALLKLDLTAAREAEIEKHAPYIAATIAQAQKFIDKRKGQA